MQRHKMTEIVKKGKRKVQGVPQSQTAALPRPQEEEETDKSKQAQIEQTYENHLRPDTTACNQRGKQVINRDWV